MSYGIFLYLRDIYSRSSLCDSVDIIVTMMCSPKKSVAQNFMFCVHLIVFGNFPLIFVFRPQLSGRLFDYVYFDNAKPK